LSSKQAICLPDKQAIENLKTWENFSHLTLQAQQADEHLCNFKTNQVYLAKTKRSKPVTTDTIARWLKTVRILNKPIINTNIFHAHSTRAASTSAAKTQNYPLAPS
jgi:hypothetical protein